MGKGIGKIGIWPEHTGKQSIDDSKIVAKIRGFMDEQKAQPMDHGPKAQAALPIDMLWRMDAIQILIYKGHKDGIDHEDWPWGIFFITLWDMVFIAGSKLVRMRDHEMNILSG